MKKSTHVLSLIVSGSREFTDYTAFKKLMNRVLSMYLKDDVEIVHGDARGTDTLADDYAKEMGYFVKPFPADWDNLGNSAGHIRNAEMADYGNALIAFLIDGLPCKGTRGMIKVAKRKGLKVRVFMLHKEQLIFKGNGDDC